MAELEGRTLDRYELRQIIGKGGMAQVYEAYDPSFHRIVAVKVFKREDDEMLRRFIREARVMASLHHPHLVQIYDSGECELDGVSHSYIVMPKLTGGTLRTRIRRNPLSLAEVCQCLNDIAGALDYIHAEGIIHRDIKASNVLLNDEGRCYLADFGIARIVNDATQLTTTGNVLGTVDYVAPELFEVHRRADARSDLYSLGVLLYEMVTGRLPFSADNPLALIAMHASKQPPSPRQYVPQLSPQVEQVMLKALAKQPEMRYGSAAELAEAFSRAVNAPVVAQSEVETVIVSKEPLAVAPGVHASPLAGETEGFVVTSPAQLVLPGTPGDTMPPLPLRTPQSARKPRPTRTVLLAIFAVAVLLILAVPVTFALLNNANRPGGISQGTVTPVGSVSQGTGNAVATAHAQATASALAAEAATANAQASATVGPIATATSGQPAYQDALTDASDPVTQAAQWDQDDQCFFASDGYHIKQPASLPYFKGCRERNNTYLDFALSVNVNLLSGTSGGVFFRLSTNLLGNYDGYLFEIDNQGRYKISQEQGATITALQDWTITPALHTGYGTKNLLQIVARGNTFLFYVNGHFLTQVQNGYYNQLGTLGFLATSVAGGSDAEVVYSGLKVYSLA